MNHSIATSNRKEPRVLIGCEFSQTTMSAFMDAGFDTFSCDILACEGPYPERHFQCDVRDVLDLDWDLMIVAHPPCTRLCNSGVRWLDGPPTNPPADSTPEQAAVWSTLDHESKKAIMWQHLDQGAELFSTFLNAQAPYICIENPVMHKHAKARITNYVEFSQSVQPWQYGHDETKRTCFWLKGLPDLVPNVTVKPEQVSNRVHSLGPSADRWKQRSKFFSGIANAMVKQWAPILEAHQEAA